MWSLTQGRGERDEEEEAVAVAGPGRGLTGGAARAARVEREERAPGRGVKERAPEEKSLAGPEDERYEGLQGAARQRAAGLLADGAGVPGWRRPAEDAHAVRERYAVKGAFAGGDGAMDGARAAAKSLDALNPLALRRAVQALRQLRGRRGTGDLPELAAPLQGRGLDGGQRSVPARAAQIDAASIDRAFERDARRYDRGYILF